MIQKTPLLGTNYIIDFLIMQFVRKYIYIYIRYMFWNQVSFFLIATYCWVTCSYLSVKIFYWLGFTAKSNHWLINWKQIYINLKSLFLHKWGQAGEIQWDSIKVNSFMVIILLCLEIHIYFTNKIWINYAFLLTWGSIFFFKKRASKYTFQHYLMDVLKNISWAW